MTLQLLRLGRKIDPNISDEKSEAIDCQLDLFRGNPRGGKIERNQGLVRRHPGSLTPHRPAASAADKQKSE